MELIAIAVVACLPLASPLPFFGVRLALVRVAALSGVPSAAAWTRPRRFAGTHAEFRLTVAAQSVPPLCLHRMLHCGCAGRLGVTLRVESRPRWLRNSKSRLTQLRNLRYSSLAHELRRTADAKSRAQVQRRGQGEGHLRHRRPRWRQPFCDEDVRPACFDLRSAPGGREAEQAMWPAMAMRGSRNRDNAAPRICACCVLSRALWM